MQLSFSLRFRPRNGMRPAVTSTTGPNVLPIESERRSRLLLVAGASGGSRGASLGGGRRRAAADGATDKRNSQEQCDQLLHGVTVLSTIIRAE